jgi:hypothetical protein
MSTRSDFAEFVKKHGAEFQNVQTVRLGNLSHVVETGTPGLLWARQWNGKEIKVINRANVPSDFDLRVLVGSSVIQPSLWFILLNMEDYLTPAAGGRIGYHHAQHEFGGPDEVAVNRKQITALTVRVVTAAAFIVLLYGDVANTQNGLIKIDSQYIDLSTYIPDAGAIFVNIETDESGTISIHEGDTFGSPALADIAYVPTPDPGKYLIAFVLLHEGQTELSDGDIHVPMPLGLNPADFSSHDHTHVIALNLDEVDISNPPTAEELDSILDSAVTKGAGYTALIQDTNSGNYLYLVVSDGSRWWYHSIAKARYALDPELVLVGTRVSPSPDIYANGIAVGELDATAGDLELVLASGGSLSVVPPHGHITAFDADGTVRWTFTDPATGYGMLVDIGDVNGDGVNEVGATFNETAGVMYLLDNTGAEIWHYNMVGGGYARAVKIGKVRDDYPHNQIVVGGYNGQFALLDEDGAEIWLQDLGSLTIQDAEIADTDGDDVNEIIIAYDQYVRKYDNTGTQVWSAHLGDVGNDVLAVEVGKVTSDPGLQIAAVVRPRTTGSVRSCFLLDKDGNTLWSWTPPGSSGCQGLKIADVDGDGNNEVIVGYGDTPDVGDPGPGNIGGVAVLDGAGNLLASYDLDQISSFIEWGDVNGDGVNEIIASCDDGTVYLLQWITGAELANIGRITAFEDTIANVEAAAGDLAEMGFAMDTTDGKLGIHISGTWYWFAPAITDHNTLDGLQGGTTDEYYHLTQTQHDTLTDGSNADALHTHSGLGRYRQFVYDLSGGDIVFLTDEDGNPLFSLEDLE